jgi:hypothetical protein
MLLTGNRLPSDQHGAFQALIESSFISLPRIVRPQTPRPSPPPDVSHSDGILASWNASGQSSLEEMSRQVRAEIGKTLR